MKLTWKLDRENEVFIILAARERQEIERSFKIHGFPFCNTNQLNRTVKKKHKNASLSSETFKDLYRHSLSGDEPIEIIHSQITYKRIQVGEKPLLFKEKRKHISIRIPKKAEIFNNLDLDFYRFDLFRCFFTLTISDIASCRTEISEYLVRDGMWSDSAAKRIGIASDGSCSCDWEMVSGFSRSRSSILSFVLILILLVDGFRLDLGERNDVFGLVSGRRRRRRRRLAGLDSSLSLYLCLNGVSCSLIFVYVVCCSSLALEKCWNGENALDVWGRLQTSLSNARGHEKFPWRN